MEGNTMSKFTKFMKQNQIKKENTTYKATKSLLDENGEALDWVIKPLTTKENDAIMDECTVDVPMKNNPTAFRTKLDESKYWSKVISASVVEPNLYDKELQDSYGVMTPEDLILEMVNDPVEFAEFRNFINNYNGRTSLEEDIAEAKK